MTIPLGCDAYKYAQGKQSMLAIKLTMITNLALESGLLLLMPNFLRKN